jgi:glycerol-3-phosphate O-acyltransferase
VTVTPKSSSEVVEYGFELAQLSRKDHPLGEVIALDPQQAITLTYFRNNTAHLLAIPSLIAACFLRRRTIEPSHLQRVVSDVYPFLRTELYLPWTEDEFPDVLESCLQLMQRLGLLERLEDSGAWARAMGGSEAAARMNLLARSLLPTLERYYITIAVLTKNGSGSLSRLQLERLCILTAQRISMLQEFEAPEFYDRNLFQQYINELRKREYLLTGENETLQFGERLALMGEDARFFLEKEIRHGIIQVAPHVLVSGPG